jgi:hypothetical protein
MKTSQVVAAVLCVCLAAVFTGSSAQTSDTKTRAQVKADRDAFMKTHEWDEQTATWVAKPGTKDETAAASTQTRSEAKKDRDAFLSKNKYDDSCACYKPIGGAPRDVSTLTKEQRKAEIADFNRTHRYDDATATWVERK